MTFGIGQRARSSGGGGGGTDAVARATATQALTAVQSIQEPATTAKADGDVVFGENKIWQANAATTVPNPATDANFAADGTWDEFTGAAPTPDPEVFLSTGDLTGAAPAGAKTGYRTTAPYTEFFVDGGNWTAVPVTTIDPAAAVPPAADDALGLVGTSTEYARADHKHPQSPVPVQGTVLPAPDASQPRLFTVVDADGDIISKEELITDGTDYAWWNFYTAPVVADTTVTIRFDLEARNQLSDGDIVYGGDANTDVTWTLRNAADAEVQPANTGDMATAYLMTTGDVGFYWTLEVADPALVTEMNVASMRLDTDMPSTAVFENMVKLNISTNTLTNVGAFPAGLEDLEFSNPNRATLDISTLTEMRRIKLNATAGTLLTSITWPPAAGKQWEYFDLSGNTVSDATITQMLALANDPANLITNGTIDLRERNAGTDYTTATGGTTGDFIRADANYMALDAKGWTFIGVA